MCGIAGIFQPNGHPVKPMELDRLTDALSHRGPDGRGTHIEGCLGIGHRRLAILDLTNAGKCPMRYEAPDGRRYWITYNGEIYNFIELKKELEELGHRFTSQTDTEVVVAAYAQWGEQCLPKFNGMWAFAIWDSLNCQLFLARDRFAIKPLYYIVSHRLVFASEFKAFLELDEFVPALNEEIVPLIIRNAQGYEGLTDQTVMKGVRKLPGGHCLTMDARGKAVVSKWWETRDHLLQVPDRYEDQVEQFRNLFIDAVRIRMRSDVAVGTCLSGGIDSSAVSCSMNILHQDGKHDLRRCSNDWQRSFVATFPGSNIDERQFADEVVRHTGVKPHYWEFDKEKTLSHIIDSVWSMEDIYCGIAVPIWCIYREMRYNNIYVTIDGHGGDELLGGYTWYLDWAMNQVNQNLYNDFHTNLLPSILRNFDHCSMAHGIEIRMPFLDWRMVSFSFGLPAGSKMGCGYTKRILRDAMKDIMPDRIRTRINKVGFNSPMIEWYNNKMSAFIEKIVNHRLWLGSPFWNGKKMRDEILFRTRRRSWNYRDWDFSLHVWVLMNIVIWQLLFVERNISEIQL